MRFLQVFFMTFLLWKADLKAVNKKYDIIFPQDTKTPYDYSTHYASKQRKQYIPLIDNQPIFIPEEFAESNDLDLKEDSDLKLNQNENSVVPSLKIDELFPIEPKQDFKQKPSKLKDFQKPIETKASKDEYKGTVEETKASKDEYKGTVEETKANKDEDKGTVEETKAKKDEYKGTVEETKASKDEYKESVEEKKDSKKSKQKPNKKICKVPKNKVKKVTNAKKDSVSNMNEKNNKIGMKSPQNVFNDSSQSGRNAVDTSDKEFFDEHLTLQEEVKSMFGPSFKSFVFNPLAPTKSKFQECNTSKNESGLCRYVQHCFLPSIVSSIQQFMNNVCIIENRFIGVCCPDFPIQTVFVKWKDGQQSFDDKETFDQVKSPKECGVGTNTRIVGGTDANVKAWPWMVALLNNKKEFFCGGSLINNRYVLTAAHCTFGLKNDELIARVGEFDLRNDKGEDYRVIEIKRHGQYNRFTLRNDVALLKLEKPVIFNEFIQTVCFPEETKNYTGKIATLAGWGRLQGGVSPFTSDVLQEVDFPIVTNEECSSTHGLPIPESLICTSAPSKDKSACNGDSGGPLMMLDDENRWKVVGIVSWGRRGCNTKFPSVFTRVSHYLDWIKHYSV